MSRVYIGIGSNVDRENSIRGALRELTARYGDLTLSPVYESRAQGFEGENFFNLVAGFDTTETIENIKQTLSRIEAQFGRIRGGARYGPRTLDLDLLLYGDTVQHDTDTNLPHPDILRYAFVLRPLADIAPDLRHPETGRTCGELWREFEGDRQGLWRTDFDPRA